MFREIRNVRQERGAGIRRWFESDGLDLVVWLSPAGEMAGFQLCYDFGRGEHALTWRPSGGFDHSEVDAGETTPLKNETPILIPVGNAPWIDLLRAFEARSSTLEPRLRDLIAAKLRAEAKAQPQS